MPTSALLAHRPNGYVSIITGIFPGGRLPCTETMDEQGEKGRLASPRRLSLRPHYIKTLHICADTLESEHERPNEGHLRKSLHSLDEASARLQAYFPDETLDMRLVT